MKRSEIFDFVVNAVCEECEIDYDMLISGCKMQKCVDARILAVHYLRVLGLSNDGIADVILTKTLPKDQVTINAIKRKARGINTEFHLYTDRCLLSDEFRSHSTVIRKVTDKFISHLREEEMK